MSQPHHLMLIDADAAEAYGWARVLGRHGFRVSVVSGGPAAIARQASDPANAVIVDVLTAELSALAATLRLQTPGLIIVAVAGPQETGAADLTLVKPMRATWSPVCARCWTGARWQPARPTARRGVRSVPAEPVRPPDGPATRA